MFESILMVIYLSMDVPIIERKAHVFLDFDTLIMAI